MMLSTYRNIINGIKKLFSNSDSTSKNVLDLVLSKIKTAENNDLMLLLNVIQDYSSKGYKVVVDNNKINHMVLYATKTHFSKDYDCFDYFVKKMLSHHFKPQDLNRICQAIQDEINQRQ